MFSMETFSSWPVWQQLLSVSIFGFLCWVLSLATRLIINYRKASSIPGTWQPFPTLTKIPWLSPYVFFGSFKETDQLMRLKGCPETRTTRITLSKQNSINFCDKELLKEILVQKNHLFTKPPHLYELFNTFGVNILSSLGSDESWKKHHRVASNAFSSKNLEHMTEVAVKSVDLIRAGKWNVQMIDALKEGKEGLLIDSNSDFSDITLDVLGKAGFGLDFSIFDDTNPEGKVFRKSLETMFSTGVILNHLFKDLIPIFHFALPLANKWFGIDTSVSIVRKKLNEIISNRKSELEKRSTDEMSDSTTLERRDLLSLMVEANLAENILTDQELISDAYIFSLAGHETTSTALQWTCYELAKNPHIQCKLRNEIDEYFGRGANMKKPHYDDFPQLTYATAVLLESLRLHPPVMSVFRTAKKDTKIGKFDIPKDTFISINIYSANVYEKNWEKPFEFNPERFPMDNESQMKKMHDFTWLSFSAGSRKCIGFKFAQLEAFVILCRMVQFYEFQLLNDETNEKDKVVPLPGVTVRPANMKLLLKPRTN